MRLSSNDFKIKDLQKEIIRLIMSLSVTIQNKRFVKGNYKFFFFCQGMKFSFY